jgi:hypothetical protein
VQIFTPEGRFVAEQFVDLDSSILQARGIAFSPDQRFLYLGGTPVKKILNRRTSRFWGRSMSARARRIIRQVTRSRPITRATSTSFGAELTWSRRKSGGTGAY